MVAPATILTLTGIAGCYRLPHQGSGHARCAAELSSPRSCSPECLGPPGQCWCVGQLPLAHKTSTCAKSTGDAASICLVPLSPQKVSDPGKESLWAKKHPQRRVSSSLTPLSWTRDFFNQVILENHHHTIILSALVKIR